MNEKETKADKETTPKTLPVKKHQGRYSTGTDKVTAKLNEAQTGLQRPRGKKQRRQFKLDPNRG
jgi:hypothetical protein